MTCTEGKPPSPTEGPLQKLSRVLASACIEDNYPRQQKNHPVGSEETPTQGQVEDELPPATPEKPIIVGPFVVD